MIANRTFAWYCLVLFALALAPRLFYASAVRDQFDALPAETQATSRAGYLLMDSADYLDLSEKISAGDFASAISLKRTIGYPAFLALLNRDPASVLTAQALLLALVPVCVALLVRLVAGSAVPGLLAGAVSCVSPTGVAIGSYFLTDALFASLFAVLFTATAYGVLGNAMRWVWIAALLSGVALLVRPMFVLWPVVATGVSILIAAGRTESPAGLLRGLATDSRLRREMLVLFGVPAAFALAYASLNASQNGLFTVSTGGQVTIRFYLALKAEEWARSGHAPAKKPLREKQVAIRDRYRALSDRESAARYLPESVAIFKRYPVHTMKAFASNVLHNARSGWGHFPIQLPLSGPETAAVFARAARFESRVRPVLLLLALGAPWIALVLSCGSPWPGARRAVASLFALAFASLFFVAASGVIYASGSRILYPIEALELAASGILATVVVRAIGRIRGGARTV